MNATNRDELHLNTQLVSIRIPEGTDTSKPVPIRISISPDAPNAWATGDGRRVFSTEEWAAKAMTMDTDEYRDASRRRFEAGRLVKAEVVEDYDGWITRTGDEGEYFGCVADMLEHYEDHYKFDDMTDEERALNKPAWAYCCEEREFDFDLEGAIESYLEDEHHEDAIDHLVGVKELTAFFDAWKQKQKLRSYFMDTSRILVIDRERYERELAEAKEILSAAE